MTTDNQLLKQILDFAVDIAREAGKITWRHYQGSFVAERKADNSFVTIADREYPKRGTERIAESLNRKGFSAAMIHGDRSQSQRTTALTGFQQGRFRVLVATDLASRGIHNVTSVSNCDSPLRHEIVVSKYWREGPKCAN